MRTKKIYVKGMHCVSCEKLLNDELKNVEEVRSVKADRKTCVVEIDYKGKEPKFSKLEKVIKKFGYDAFENDPGSQNMKKEKATWLEWLNAIIIVVILFLVYRVFKNFGVIDKINLQGAEINYGISILIGLVASISSCLAVVGAVVIAFGEKYKSNGGSFFENAVKPNLYFHIGRLVTFFILGGLLGVIGREISISGNFISIFTIIVAVIMGWLGLNILGIIPSISNTGIRMPKKFTGKWEKLKTSEHKAAPFFFGRTEFLPSLRIHSKHADIRSGFRKFLGRRPKLVPVRIRNRSVTSYFGRHCFMDTREKNGGASESSRFYRSIFCNLHSSVRVSSARGRF